MLKLIGLIVVIYILVQFISGLIEGSIGGHNRAMRDIKKEQEEKNSKNEEQK